jgi:hypothetical protein
LQAEEASEQNEAFLLSPLDEVKKIKEEYIKKVAEVQAKKQSKTLPDLDKTPVINHMLLITTALDDDQDWGTIDEKWGPLPQPNGWKDKNYMKDNYLVLPPPLSPKTWEYLLQEDDEMEAGKILNIPLEIKEEMGTLNDWPSIPLEGNNMHPLHLSFYGANPREGWQYNCFGHLDYYWFLITDPNFSIYQMVAPWIKYNLNPALLQIFGSFGINYPITTCILWPSPVDYHTPILTPEQVCPPVWPATHPHG